MREEDCLYGLAYNCPYIERQFDCALMQLEHLSFITKVKWIDNLSDEEKKANLEHHQACSGNR